MIKVRKLFGMGIVEPKTPKYMREYRPLPHDVLGYIA